MQPCLAFYVGAGDSNSGSLREEKFLLLTDPSLVPCCYSLPDLFKSEKSLYGYLKSFDLFMNQLTLASSFSHGGTLEENYLIF